MLRKRFCFSRSFFFSLLFFFSDSSLFFNSKLGPLTESVSSSSSPKDGVPSSPQVPRVTSFKYLIVSLLRSLCISLILLGFRSDSLILTSSILWLPRKPVSPTSATEGLPRLHPPPRLIAARMRAAPSPSARPCPPASPRAPPPTSPSRPTLPFPLTSSPRWRPTPTRPAPPRVAEPRTCRWTRARPAETRLPACSRRAGPYRNVTDTPPPFPDPLPPRAHLLVPRSQLPPPSSPALLCPAIRSSKRNPKSTKRKIERRTKGSGQIDAAQVLVTAPSSLKRLEPKRGAALRRRAESSSTRVLTATEVCFCICNVI